MPSTRATNDSLALAAGDPLIDANDVVDVAGFECAHVQVVARERLEVVRSSGAIVDFSGRKAGDVRGRQGLVAVMRLDPVVPHGAVQDHGAREFEARTIEKLHDRVIAPGGGRPDRRCPQALGLALEPGQQR
jgi:hypothetical protein